MGIVKSIGIFILGFFAEKILDLVVNVVKQKLAKRKKEKEVHNFYTDSHQDIIITASGVPCFLPRQIKEDISKEKPFLLAKPVDASSDDSFSFSDTDCVTDAFINYIQDNSLQNQLEEARNAVFESFFKKSNGNYFNGTLMGVRKISGFSRTTDTREEPILNIKLYKTDYFTHRIIEQLIKNISFNSNMLNETDFSWSRTSFGVSVILIIPKQNEIILTKRAINAAYANNKEWIYVSVTETLSETDYNEETGCPDLRKCVLRGINEELGITERELKIDTLCFYDTFYETHFHQDNIVASIEISDELTFSNIYSLLAKDKYMEVADILTIPKDKKIITDFIKNNKDNMRAQTIFSLESFAARM